AAGAVDRLATAGAGISSLAIGAGGRQVATGACAAVEPPLALEAVEGTVVPPRVVALAPGRRWRTLQRCQRAWLGVEAKPGELGEDAALEGRTAPRAIVILHPDHHLEPERTGNLPE